MLCIQVSRRIVYVKPRKYITYLGYQRCLFVDGQSGGWFGCDSESVLKYFKSFLYGAML